MRLDAKPHRLMGLQTTDKPIFETCYFKVGFLFLFFQAIFIEKRFKKIMCIFKKAHGQNP